MDIQPRGLFLAIALHHAVKLPAVTLIKRGVVSNKVKVRAASMPLAAGMEKDKKNARDTSLFESLKKAKLPWPVAPLYGITLDCKVVYV